MYTSLSIIALSGLLALPGTEGPSWHTNYPAARKLGEKLGKPVAVIFGSGQTGYEKVAWDGLNPATRKVLAAEYVCCYVDMSTKAGQVLAATFEIKKTAGVVLSDRSGKKMAFHHDGRLIAAELRRCLERFADPNLVVHTTVTDLETRTSAYTPPQPTTTPTTSTPRPVNIPAAFQPAQFGGRNC